MAKKQTKKQQPKRAPTKKQLSRVQQQKKMKRIIYIAGAVFLVLVLGFIGYGYYNEQYKPYHSTVLKVNGTSFDMNDYVQWLEVYTSGLDRNSAINMASLVPSAMIQSEIIRQRAPELGYTVTDEEIRQGLEEEGVTESDINRGAYEAQLLSEKMLADYFDKQVPQSGPQVNALAMALPSDEQARQIRDDILAGADFKTLAGENSVEYITQSESGELGWIPEDYARETLGSLNDSELPELLFSLQPGALSMPVYDNTIVKDGGYWLLKVTEKDPGVSVHVYGILLGSAGEAEEARERLEAGEDFEELATEISQDETSAEYGGDLGWMQSASGNEAMVNAVFALDVDEVSDPVYDETVATSGGYWLAKVVEAEDDRAIDTDVREQIKQRLFQEWLNEQIESSEVEQMLTPQQQEWALNKVLKDNSGA